MTFTDTGRIRGQDDEIAKINNLVQDIMPGMANFPVEPDADIHNYGGERIDAFFGVSFTKGALSVGIEGGIPAYQRVNGLQMETDWFITSGIQVMF
ncbi:alpha amylase domain-containing protein [Candidatus Omnitrophus magneticus]|uniref:Alpha amylase domain-containing protein n=1 Tax=Candidatus Omnitrophus magneticus TaxID=1609969 RepID=A0A0F0CT64_9BACT|nr:alpha amylase domain-containing protein [Candidatus Omnitrophus magneticus]